MDYTNLDLLEEVMMAENQFYKEDVKQETNEQRPRSLSLSISRPDWSSMLNTGEKSMRITDQLLDTPEILSQSLDWQLHSHQTSEDIQQYYLPETVDERTQQITAIKNELQQDYEPEPSPAPLVSQSSPYSYYTDQDHTYVEESSRADDGSVSPTYSETPSSMVADDEADDDYAWYPATRRRPGRPKSASSTSKSKPKDKRKLSEVDKESEEYKAKRRRNNVAVRKSRDKAKRHQAEVMEKNDELKKQNNDLKKQNESLVREVTVLRKLITDIGRKIPDKIGFDLGKLST